MVSSESDAAGRLGSCSARKGRGFLKLALQLEIVELCRSVANSLGRAYDVQTARWFTDVAEALESASPEGAADLTAQIHRTVRGGAGGPRGVVIVAADGRADSKATVQFHADLSRLYDLTRQSRFADWVRSFRG